MNGAEAPYLLVFIPGLGITVNACAHMLLCRVFRGVGQVRLQLICIAIGFASVVIGLRMLQPSSGVSGMRFLDHALCQVFSYAFLSFCLFNVINSTVGSLRVRMLSEYMQAHPGGLSSSVIVARYSEKEMLEVRLDRLLAGGQIEVRNGRYLAKRGLVHHIGVLFLWLRRTLLSRAT